MCARVHQLGACTGTCVCARTHWVLALERVRVCACVCAPAGCLHGNTCVCKSWERERRPRVCTRVCSHVHAPGEDGHPRATPKCAPSAPQHPWVGVPGDLCTLPALSRGRATPLVLGGSAEGARVQMGAAFTPQLSSSSSSSRRCPLHRCQTKAWAADVRDAADVAPPRVSRGQPLQPSDLAPRASHPVQHPWGHPASPQGDQSQGGPQDPAPQHQRRPQPEPPKPWRNPGVRAPPAPPWQTEGAGGASPLVISSSFLGLSELWSSAVYWLEFN